MSDSEATTFRADRAPVVPPGGVELYVRDMSGTFSGEVTLGEVQAKLAEVGQWLPVDGDGSWTVGRLVEGNSTGPLRLGFGGWRDLLLGCQFENGRGELVTAGGRTVKNVAGYDLTKFMVGHGGVFGRVVTVTTRTYRRPAGGVVARFEGAGDEALGGVIRRLLPTSCRPQWAVMDAGGVWCGYLGDERTLPYYAEAVGAYGPVEVVGETVEEDVERRRGLWGAAGVAGSFRASVPPVRMVEFATNAGVEGWAGDAAFGVVVGMMGGVERERIVEAARGVGGSVVFFGEGGRIEGGVDEGVRRLLGRLKGAFDFEGRLVGLP